MLPLGGSLLRRLDLFVDGHGGDRGGLAQACGAPSRREPPPPAAAPAGAPGATRRAVARQRAPARGGDGRGRGRRARRRGGTAQGLAQRGPRVAVEARRRRGAAPARHGPGGRGRPHGARQGEPGVRQRWLPRRSGGAPPGLPRHDAVGAPGPAGAPPPTPRGAPAGSGLGARGVTQTTQGTLLTLRPRVVRGAARLPQRGRTRRPAWVARGPLPVRQAWAPWARTTARGWQDRERLRQRVGGCQAGSQVARPPRRVRQPLPLHERPRRGAMRPRWRARTPALVAGVTEPVWTLRALLTATCAPLDSQSSSG